MDKFVDKFNIFDLFTMLIPGVVILTLIGISLSFKHYDTWAKWGNEKYMIFFIFSFLCGVIFQELGRALDDLILCKILYKGKPKEIFLMENGHEKLFNGLSYEDAVKIKKYIVESFNIDEEKEPKNILNSYIFAYCLNISEMNNLTSKSDKMLVIAEMSRSLFWGCSFTILLNIYMVLQYLLYVRFYILENILLILMCVVFLNMKKRYERYRIQILLRALLIFLKQKSLL